LHSSQLLPTELCVQFVHVISLSVISHILAFPLHLQIGQFLLDLNVSKNPGHFSQFLPYRESEQVRQVKIPFEDNCSQTSLLPLQSHLPNAENRRTEKN
jgi:hypothetical protein